MAQVDLTDVTEVGVEPGDAARDDGCLGDPAGARGRADRRLPARGDRGPRARRVRGDRPRDGRRRELQQRLGRARQARLGLRLRRPPRVGPPHRRLRRVRASSGRSARASPGGSRATRSSSTATRPPTRTSRSTASTRSPRRRSRSGATRRPGARSRSSRRSRPSSCSPSRQHLTWEEAASYGLTYFTAYRMLIDRAARSRPATSVLIWGAAGGLGVFATQLCDAGRRRARGRRLLRREGRAGQAARRGRTTSTATSSRA